MDISYFIEKIKDRLAEIQTALDESQVSQNLGVCLPVEEWLKYAIAAYAESNIMSKVDYGAGDFPAAVFSDIIEKAIHAISDGDSPESFYDSMTSGNYSANDTDFSLLAQYFCRERGSDWDTVKSAILSREINRLPGVLASFATLIVVKYDRIREALENANESSPSEAMLLQWYAAILASYCWTAEPVHTFIKNEISKYFDRWRIGDSEKHYPYVMNVDKYTKYRMGTGKAKWDNLQEKIIAYEKEFLNEKEDLDEKEDPESKNDRYILHEGKYRKVKSGNAESVKLKGVDKRVNLKDINAWYIKEDDEYRATFDLQNYSATNGDSNTRCGKGSPEAMNYVVKKLRLDGNQIDIKFLQDFALGIDCSGFVTRAIASVMTTLQIPGPIQFETLGAGYGRLKTNATTLRSTGSDVLFSYTYNKEFAGGSVKAEPKNDFQFTFQPGDIIMKKKFKVVGKKKILQSGGFHIWIIEDASADSFVALDSTAADKKGPDRQVYSSLPKFTGEVALGKVREKNEETGKYEDFEYKLEFARPKVFSDINELSRRYVSYLKDKYS